MKNFSFVCVCFFIFFIQFNAKAATYVSLATPVKSFVKSDITCSRILDSGVSGQSNHLGKKLTFKERIIMTLLKNKLKKFTGDSTSKKIVQNETGFGLGLASVISYLITGKIFPAIIDTATTAGGIAVLLLLFSLLGLGISIWAIIKSSRYIRKNKNDENAKTGLARTGKVLGIIGTVFWGLVTYIAFIVI